MQRLVAEKSQQRRIDVEVFPSGLHLLQQAAVDEGLQIDRCRLSLCDPSGNQIADPAVRMHKDDLDQLARINLRQFTSHPLGSSIEQVADSADARRRPVRRLAHRFEHVEDPVLPYPRS
jgi:hypothetical protein